MVQTRVADEHASPIGHDAADQLRRRIVEETRSTWRPVTCARVEQERQAPLEPVAWRRVRQPIEQDSDIAIALPMRAALRQTPEEVCRQSPGSPLRTSVRRFTICSAEITVV